jgi:hypothetical protein
MSKRSRPVDEVRSKDAGGSLRVVDAAEREFLAPLTQKDAARLREMLQTLTSEERRPLPSASPL